MFFEIDTDWKEMYSSGGVTGSELYFRIITDCVVEKDFIVQKVLGHISKNLDSDEEYYIVEIMDDQEKFLKSEVEEVVKDKVSRKGLNKRGGNWEMVFSIKFDNQGWWPDET
jgi:hypothetical protein